MFRSELLLYPLRDLDHKKSVEIKTNGHTHVSLLGYPPWLLVKSLEVLTNKDQPEVIETDLSA